MTVRIEMTFSLIDCRAAMAAVERHKEICR